MTLNALALLQKYFFTFITSVVILLVGFALGMVAKKFLQRVLQEVELNRISRRVNIFYNVEKAIASICAAVIYLMTVVFFLDFLGVKSMVLYLFAGALLLLVVLTFIIGLKDVLPNFIGWIYLQRNHLIKEGYHLDVQDISGTVERIGYLETEIKTERGDILYVPNNLFLRSSFKLRH